MDCQLYRHFDKGGRLLYVGISHNAVVRLSGHKASSWFSEIASVTVATYPSRELALKAERQAIRREKPLHNILHNELFDQAEMFEPDEFEQQLERIPVNRATPVSEPARSRNCTLCDESVFGDCSPKCFAKLKPAEWILDMKKTGRTVHFQDQDYTQFFGIDCYGQPVAFYVRVGSRREYCLHGTNGTLFCTYEVA